MMRKLIFACFALLLSISANAFEFDGIDLNASVLSVSRNISMRGYVNDETRPNTLKGNCQGKEIYLSLDFDNVSQKGKVGQLMVEVPMKEADALKVVTETCNVFYHQIDSVEGKATYLVDNDGTILLVEAVKGGVKFTYRTPYYKAAK